MAHPVRARRTRDRDLAARERRQFARENSVGIVRSYVDEEPAEKGEKIGKVQQKRGEKRGQ